jgi:hypothetical protein
VVIGRSVCQDRREILTSLVCGFAGGFQQLPGVFLRVALLEYSAACDQDLSTGAHKVRHGVVVDTTHFNAKFHAARLADSREQLNFSQGGVDEGLATKPRVHAHDKDMVNERKNLIDGVDRSAGIYNHSGLAPVRRDEAKGAIKMDASSLVDGDPIGSGFGERRDEFVRSFNHKVTVERHPGDLAERSYNRRSDRNIGDEVAFHDVHVENGRSALDGRLALPRQAERSQQKELRERARSYDRLIGQHGFLPSRHAPDLHTIPSCSFNSPLGNDPFPCVRVFR